MSIYKPKNRGRFIFITAVVTIIILAVVLYSVQNPEVVKEIISDNSFDTSQDFIKFVDVGQGDCAIIYSDGYCAVIDVGTSQAADEISESLEEFKVDSIDVMLISHLHDDHVGGLLSIAQDYKIDNLITPSVSKDSIKAAQNGKNAAVSNGASYYTPKKGMNFQIGEFTITLLSDFYDKNENNRSIFVMAEIDGVKFLFTGDAERKTEKRLLESDVDVDCDVLKVGHHGSSTSTCDEFLQKTTPEYAVISVGEGNAYSHPHQETMTALQSSGASIYRTDNSGDIVFDMTDDSLEIGLEK